MTREKIKTLRKPLKISLHLHKGRKLMYFRYIFGKSQRIEKDGKIIYRYKDGDKVDEYVTDLLWHKEPSNSKERQENKDTRKILEDTLEDKLYELRRGNYHLQSKDVKGRNVLDDLIEYANSTDKKYSKRTITQHISVHMHLRLFTRSQSISYDDITEEFCAEFLRYLKSDGVARMGKSLSESSVANYLNKFKVFLGIMLKKGYLMEYPANDVKVKKPKSKRKESLTGSELQMLINTDCTSPILKRWFLFSCFSGQAFAECLKMEWRDIIEEGGVTRIVGTRIKTNSDYVVPINNEAKFYLGKQGDSFKSHKVFSKLSYHGSNNRILSDWVRRAGIDKHITPHCGRNTFCRNYWVYGEKDIIALMQTLDHKDVTTTQRYLAGVIGSQYDTAVPSVGSYDLG